MKISAVEKILVVEDDQDIREALTDLLTIEGFKVNNAANGHKAIELLRSASTPKPDVILIDLMMPEKDGLQFRDEQLKDQQLSDIPVILMSANNQLAKKEPGIQFNAFLHKPIEMSLLLETIRTVSM